MPNNTMNPNIMCIGLNFVLENKGSRNAVIMGNVKSDNMPKATLDNLSA